MTDMPKRIWAWEPTRHEGYWGDDPCFVEEQGAVEYIRADSVPDFDKLAERLCFVAADLAKENPDLNTCYEHEIVADVLREAWEGGAGRGTAPDADEQLDRKAPSAPDPHEFEPLAAIPRRCGAYVDGDPGTLFGMCGRPADDPIHAAPDRHKEFAKRMTKKAVQGSPELRNYLADNWMKYADDAPHEFKLGYITSGDDLCICGRSAYDSIHEVKDDNARLGDSGAAVPGGAEADVLDSGQDTPVTVGPGDEVTRGGQIYDIVGRDKRGQAWGVLMLTCACVPLVPIESFRTLDGRPVSGFREPRAELVNAKDSVLLGQRIVELEKYVVELEGRPVMQTEWEQQQARIAELEQELRGARRLREIAHEAGTKLRHERDEARAERDVLLSGASKQAVRERELGWVRLDDETIEKVAWVMFALDNAGPHHRYLHDKLRHCLRELRDGELGGGE